MTSTGEAPRPVTPARSASKLSDVGIVVIAKNEGERLRRALASCQRDVDAVVYADSASTDDSVAYAGSLGVEVVVLDVSERPPNQPRGRNAGFRALREAYPDLRYVFFMDGDCELVDGFLEAARAELERDPKLGGVCGRRVELLPDASVYNFLIDTEWNTPVGAAEEFGGDVLLRVDALAATEGYNESMISGEDLELSYRLRRAGWGIRRIAREMTRHDVALHRFGAWWKRHARGGYAYAHGAALHLPGKHAPHVRKCVGMLFWGLFLPVTALAFVPFTGGWSALAFLAYAVLWHKIKRWRVSLGDPAKRAGVYARYIVIGKFAEALGILQCGFGLLSKRGFRYVEYKDYQRQA